MISTNENMKDETKHCILAHVKSRCGVCGWIAGTLAFNMGIVACFDEN